MRVSVKYGSYVPKCLHITASDGTDEHSGDVHISREQIEGKEVLHAIKAGVFRAKIEVEPHIVNVAVFGGHDWGRKLTINVASMEDLDGEHCAGETLEQYSTPEFITVPLKDFATFLVTLQARDDDEDGYVLKPDAGPGTDCDDTIPGIHPGAQEVCDEKVDHDCDGKLGCSDPDCMGEVCDDGNKCTKEDRCKAVEGEEPQCQGTPMTCQPPNLVCYTSLSSCDPATGLCSAVPKDPGETCSDSDPCTDNDRCNGSGECTGGPASPCTPRNNCWKSTKNCPGNGECMEVVEQSRIGQQCIEAGQSGWCNERGSCTAFRFTTSNFDPSLFPSKDRELDIHITCGTLINPVVFDSTYGKWLPPEGCALPPMPRAQFISQGDESIAVVPIKNFIIDEGNVLKLKGHRPVILAVYGNADINGRLLADADMDAPGAGGNRLGCGAQSGGNGSFASGANKGSGGGGGAFGQNGAVGGPATGSVNGGKRGEKVSSTLDPLMGGCPGGSGGGAESPIANGGLGGAGGGALQLAVAGTLTVNSWVSVSGGGGRGGKGSSNNAGGGGGGGSGGGLLLQAWNLRLTPMARLTANGGGGAGGGDSSNNAQGADGADGFRFSPGAAPGGNGNGNGGDGGDGGAAGNGRDAKDGKTGGNNGGAGGGGGGVGIILLQGFGGCEIDPSCGNPDGTGCDISPTEVRICN